VDERKNEGRDAKEYRDCERDAPREKRKQNSALCFVLVRAEHVFCYRHFIEREAGFVERVLRIGIAMGIRAVFNGTFFQILVGP